MAGNDITGFRSGKLVAVTPEGRKGGHIQWLAKCDCGGFKIVRGSRITTGKVRSCGCLVGKNNARHGMTDTPTYKSWQSMVARCKNKNDPSYKNYGAKGITVCDKWLVFDNFYEDMGLRPSKSYSLDRIDGSQGYKPKNCRWATAAEQNRNKCDNLLLTHDGKTLVATDWAKIIGIDRNVIYKRKAWGWSDKRALTTPCRKRKDNVFPQ